MCFVARSEFEEHYRMFKELGADEFIRKITGDSGYCLIIHFGPKNMEFIRTGTNKVKYK